MRSSINKINSIKKIKHPDRISRIWWELLGIALALLIIFGQQIRHAQEITALNVKHIQEVDSLQNQIRGLAQSLALFTNGKPLIFTAYNALTAQTDNTPNITASNKRIFPGVLALSRELLKPYNESAQIAYGDTVWVVIPLQVEDTMHRRWQNRADIFMLDYHQALAFGKRRGYLYHHQINHKDFAALTPSRKQQL